MKKKNETPAPQGETPTAKQIPAWFENLALEFREQQRYVRELSRLCESELVKNADPHFRKTLLYLKAVNVGYADQLYSRYNRALVQIDFDLATDRDLENRIDKILRAKCKSLIENPLIISICKKHKELEERLIKIFALINTEEFTSLCDDEQTDLLLQAKYMDEAALTEQELIDQFNEDNFIPGIGVVDPEAAKEK